MPGRCRPRHDARPAVAVRSASSTDVAAAASGPRARPGALPRSSACASPRSARMAATSGSPERRRDLGRGEAARCGAAHDQPGGRSAVLGDDGGHPRRCGAGPHVRRHHQNGEVGGCERRDRGFGGIARHVADHRVACPATGIEDRRHRRRGGAVRGPVARQDGQPTRAVNSGAGSAACRALAGTRPAPVPTSGQRRPSRSSAPSTRSTPPPRGSQSTSSARSPLRAARTAVATANTDAPAPPRPPTTASTAPPPPPPSAAWASAATSHGSASGREITCSAPTATACFHASGGGSPETATTTPGRRGSPPSRARPGGGGSSTTIGAPGQLRRSRGGVEGPHDLESGGRGRPQNRVEQLRVGHHHQPAPALVPPRRRRRLLVVPFSAHLLPPRRPARCGPPVKPGVAEAVRTDELLRCGWRKSDVDNRADPADEPAKDVGEVGHGWRPRVRGRTTTLRNRWRNTAGPNRCRLRRPWAVHPREEDELDGPRQGGLTGAVGGSAPGG